MCSKLVTENLNELMASKDSGESSQWGGELSDWWNYQSRPYGSWSGDDGNGVLWRFEND